MDDTYTRWLKIGYHEFAVHGPDNLKIEKIAKAAVLTRTSFYHYFSDKSMLIEQLLQMHSKRMNEYYSRLKHECTSYVPDVFRLMYEYKIEFLFTRQLCINRNRPAYEKLFNETMENDTTAFRLWAEYMNIETNDIVARQAHQLLFQNLFAFITPDNFSYDSLVVFMDEMKHIIQNLIRQSHVKVSYGLTMNV
jgi:AcrR family transcriptional regulator